MEYRLTKGANALLLLLYAEYRSRLKTMPEDSARYFDSEDEIKLLSSKKFDFEDVNTHCRELYDADLLDCIWVDDTFVCARLTSDAIIYVENIGRDNVKQIMEFVKAKADVISAVCGLF